MKPRIDCDPKKSHYKQYDVIEGILKSAWNRINNLFYFRNVFLIETSYLGEEEQILGGLLGLTWKILWRLKKKKKRKSTSFTKRTRTFRKSKQGQFWFHVDFKFVNMLTSFQQRLADTWLVDRNPHLAHCEMCQMKWTVLATGIQSWGAHLYSPMASSPEREGKWGN